MRVLLSQCRLGKMWHSSRDRGHSLSEAQIHYLFLQLDR